MELLTLERISVGLGESSVPPKTKAWRKDITSPVPTSFRHSLNLLIRIVTITSGQAINALSMLNIPERLKKTIAAKILPVW
jgi:hypothetical protein